MNNKRQNANSIQMIIQIGLHPRRPSNRRPGD
jgi:hypothetical protein